MGFPFAPPLAAQVLLAQCPWCSTANTRVVQMPHKNSVLVQISTKVNVLKILLYILQISGKVQVYEHYKRSFFFSGKSVFFHHPFSSVCVQHQILLLLCFETNDPDF